jgi:hypothetical protein
MADASTFTPGMAKFVMTVSKFSTRLGKCSAVYRNIGVTVAAWDRGKAPVQLTDEDDVYIHYDGKAAATALMRGETQDISREIAAELDGYAGMNGIPMGSPAPPKP